MNIVETIPRKSNYNCLDDFTDPIPVIPENYLDSYENCLDASDLLLTSAQTSLVSDVTDPVQYDHSFFEDITCEFPVIVLGDLAKDSGQNSQQNTSNNDSESDTVAPPLTQPHPYPRSLLSCVFFGAIMAALINVTIFNSDHRYAVAHAFPIFENHFHSAKFRKNSGDSGVFDYSNNSKMPQRNIVNNLDSQLIEQFNQQKQINSLLRPMYVLPVNGIFTSSFTYRWGAMHTGIDLAAPIGTPIVSVSDGTVIEAGWVSGFGQWVRVLADNGTINIYGHVNTVEVIKGQRVAAGQRIATVGNLGFATGPHLHFEVWIQGKWKVDPAVWLAQRGIALNAYNP